MRFVTLDGRKYRMKDIHEEYKRQRDAQRRHAQLTLFDLKQDCRPQSQRCADGRYSQPLLFESVPRPGEGKLHGS